MLKKKFFKETGIYPIMHTVAIKREVYEEYPWIARNLMTAFEEARDRSVARLTSVTASQIPVPWGYVNAGAPPKQFLAKKGCGHMVWSQTARQSRLFCNTVTSRA